MTTLLDVSSLPATHTYVGTTSSTELADLIPAIKDTLELWARLGIIRNTIDSFGFAVSFVEFDDLEDVGVYDDPQVLVSFVGGWGEDMNRYIANAARKLRPAARTSMDSLDLVMDFGHMFQDEVPSVDEDGNFPWGDFSYGGATFEGLGKYNMLIAVSTLTQEQDDFVAGFMGKLFGLAMYVADKPVAPK